MRYKLFALTSILVFSVGVIFYLLADSRPGRGGFYRKFLTGPLSFQNVVNLNNKGNYIAGFSNPVVFIENSEKPGEILRFDIHTLRSLPAIRLNENEINLKRDVRLSIIQSSFTIIDYSTTQVTFGALQTGRVNDRFLIGDIFSDVVALTDHSVATRLFNQANSEFVLAKNMNGKTLQYPHILQKQIDGRFCTDGFLNFNAKHQRLIFTYYYRNQFIAMDTNLVVKLRGHTIDTVSRVRIKVSEQAGDGTYSLRSPARYVNKMGFTQDDFLYISSAVLSDNDEDEFLNADARIDVYNIQMGNYLGSFRIPRYGKTRMKAFVTAGRDVVTLNGEHLVRYRFGSGN